MKRAEVEEREKHVKDGREGGLREEAGGEVTRKKMVRTKMSGLEIAGSV